MDWTHAAVGATAFCLGAITCVGLVLWLAFRAIRKDWRW